MYKPHNNTCRHPSFAWICPALHWSYSLALYSYKFNEGAWGNFLFATMNTHLQQTQLSHIAFGHLPKSINNFLLLSQFIRWKTSHNRKISLAKQTSVVKEPLKTVCLHRGGYLTIRVIFWTHLRNAIKLLFWIARRLDMFNCWNDCLITSYRSGNAKKISMLKLWGLQFLCNNILIICDSV